MPTAHRGSQLGEVIKAYMKTRGLTTHDAMARVLGVERSLVTKYVQGSRTCRDVEQLLRFAEAMEIAPEVFGLSGNAHSPHWSADIAEWKVIRQTLNRNRHALTSVAAHMYWDPVRIEGTRCLSRPGWLAAEPLDLDAVQLDLAPDVDEPLMNGGEVESETVRPVRVDGPRYERYSQAVRAIAQPALFENRTSYRLLDAEFDQRGGRMRFGLTTYFDMLDVCEALAHETAAAWVASGSPDRLDLGELPFRQRIGDLFDTGRRALLPSINTLTIRRGNDGDTFFLHRRGQGSVTLAAGLSHIIPAGVFQPAAVGPWNVARDFDLWRNMLREFFEEFLDAPEHDGSRGTSVDYAEEPYALLSRARRDGGIRVWCFGVGLDPLAPAGEILTTAVFDAETFDRAFSGIVSQNAEGEIETIGDGTLGTPWTADNVRRVLNHEPLAPAAAACIALTWRHRAMLLP
ncbi:helix-turn-helix domain-containing protein [Nocardia carnea]|uniref:Helix-turn-helix domain-containing protein n=1 Tax=Nocardia carnea TaxID=37328 RepID=A0ABW7TNM2_9NOCA|nr:helix-turn-helix transcriptional regulator [Nocardia carnea]